MDWSNTCLHQIKKTNKRCRNRIASTCEYYCSLHAFHYDTDTKRCVDIEYINVDERRALVLALEKLEKELTDKKIRSEFMNKIV